MAREKKGKDGLTDKQRAFAHEYVKDFSGAAAARRAGYSEAVAHAQVSRLLGNEKIQALISSLAREMSESAGLTAQDVVDKTALLLEKSMREHPDGKGSYRMEAPQVAAKCLDVLYRYHGLYEADNEQKGDPLAQVLEQIGGSLLDNARDRTQRTINGQAKRIDH